MKLHNLSHAKELISVAEEMGINVKLFTAEEANKYIGFIFNKYKPWKVEGHISIGDNVSRLPTDEHEFTFSLSMKHVPAFLFFEQNYINKDNVLLIENSQDISTLMKNSHGMEYFISDKEGTYLIAVNWYSIEYTGDILLK